VPTADKIQNDELISVRNTIPLAQVGVAR